MRGVKLVSGLPGWMVLASLPLLGASGAFGSQEDYIVIGLEEPAAGSVATGVSNLRGYAVGKFGVERIELMIDGEYRFDLPYRGKRGDVGNSYSYPDDEYSGFSMAFNYSMLEPGEHTVTVRAWDIYNDFNEVTHTFEVVRFDDESWTSKDRWIDDIDLSLASAAIYGNDVVLMNAILNEKPFNMRLSWRAEAQKPEIVSIDGFELSSMMDVDGDWVIELETDKTDCGGSVDVFNGELPIASSGYYLDMNGLTLVFAGVESDTLAVNFEGTQEDPDGDVLWAVSFSGDSMNGTGEQFDAGDECTVLYGLTGTKRTDVASMP
jgi:hypothetical protein